MIITIDGPAGVGKSTAAKMLAMQLGLTYLDTGATYRTLAYVALKKGLDTVMDAKALAREAGRLALTLRQGKNGEVRVLLKGKEITHAIRTEEISEAAASLSRHPGVRQALVRFQRGLVSQRGAVTEGRDTGTVVFPHASYKFFLTASLGIRAKRRQEELKRFYGTRLPLARIRQGMGLRDRIDRTRRTGRLIKPKGALTIRTSELSSRQVVQKMLHHIGAVAKGSSPLKAQG